MNEQLWDKYSNDLQNELASYRQFATESSTCVFIWKSTLIDFLASLPYRISRTSRYSKVVCSLSSASPSAH